MPDDNSHLLVPRGHSTEATRVTLHSHAYTSLMRLVRIASPSESAGVLIGEVGRSNGQEWFTIHEVQPVELVPSGSGKSLAREAWADLQGTPTSRGHTRPHIIGWYFADPSIGVSTPNLDLTQIQRDVGRDAALFLLVNPAREEGAFYLWRGDTFVPIGGFYEVLPEEDAEPVIPWRGEVVGAAGWLPVADRPPALAVGPPQADTTVEGAHAADAFVHDEAANDTDVTERLPVQVPGVTSEQDQDAVPAPSAVTTPASEVASDFRGSEISRNEKSDTLNILIDLAHTLEAQGDKSAAIETYRYALDLLLPESAAAGELLGRIYSLEERAGELETAAQAPPAPQAQPPAPAREARPTIPLERLANLPPEKLKGQVRPMVTPAALQTGQTGELEMPPPVSASAVEEAAPEPIPATPGEGLELVPAPAAAPPEERTTARGRGRRTRDRKEAAAAAPEPTPEPTPEPEPVAIEAAPEPEKPAKRGRDRSRKTVDTAIEEIETPTEATVSAEHLTREELVEAELREEAEKPAKSRRSHKRKRDAEILIEAPTAAAAETEAGLQATLVDAEFEPGPQIPAELPDKADEPELASPPARKGRSRRTTAAEKKAQAEAEAQAQAQAEAEAQAQTDAEAQAIAQLLAQEEAEAQAAAATARGPRIHSPKEAEESGTGLEAQSIYSAVRSGVPPVEVQQSHQVQGAPTVPLQTAAGPVSFQARGALDHSRRNRLPAWVYALGAGSIGILLVLWAVVLIGGLTTKLESEGRDAIGSVAGAGPTATLLTQALPLQGEGDALAPTPVSSQPPAAPPDASAQSTGLPAEVLPTETLQTATEPPTLLPQAPPASPTLPPASPTSMPVPTSLPPSPTPVIASNPAPSAEQEVLNRVAAAEAAVLSGQLQATLTNRDGSQSSAQMLFNLGDGGSISAFHITTTYTATNGASTLEQITIKDASWERQGNGPWKQVSLQEAAWGQVRAFMPQAEYVNNTSAANEGITELHWYDAVRDADSVLVVDATTGIPRELRRVTRSTGSVLVVTYSGWNTPADIKPPDIRRVEWRIVIGH